MKIKKRNEKIIKNIMMNKFDPKEHLDLFFGEMQSRSLDPEYMAEHEAFSEQMRKYSAGVFQERRKEALLRLLPVLKMINIPESENYDEAGVSFLFYSYEVNTGCNYNILDEHGDIRLGAAIWILDHLRLAGNLDKAMEYLPYIENKPDTSMLPKNFYHPCYSRALLESMMSMITTRFETAQTKAMDRIRASENILFEDNVEGSGYTAVFQKIIGLLPQAVVKYACGEFRNMVLKTIEIYLNTLLKLLEKDTYYSEELKSLHIRAQVPNISSIGAGSVVPINNITTRNCNTITDPSDISGVPYGNKEPRPLNTVYADRQYCIQKLEQIWKTRKQFKIDLKNFFIYDRDQLHDIFDDKELEDLFLNYCVADPLAICFALIYLLDHGDDIPWLFQSAGCVMNATCCSLPWCLDRKEGRPTNNHVSSDWKPLFTLMSEPGADKKSDGINGVLGKNPDQRLAQVLYQLTGCILPTDFPSPSETCKELTLLDLSSAETAFVSGVAHTLYLSSRQARMSEETGDIENTDVDENEDASDGTDGSDAGTEDAYFELDRRLSEVSNSYDALQKELLRAKQEIKNLKRTAAEDRKQYAANLLKKDAEVQRSRLEHRELVDLRELVFKNMNKDSSPDISHNKDSIIHYPYETKKRVVIFGGRASFRKKMKDYLPTVRQVDIDNTAFNPDIVRNADVIWIQAACLMHRQFYKLINEARLYNIQVRYFKFPSADKSARQVVEDDQSSGQ